jgi:curved DNA-binding protein CbpA
MEDNREYKQYLLQQQRIIQKQQEQIQSLLNKQQKEDMQKTTENLPSRNSKKLKIDPYKILSISKEDANNEKKLKKAYLKYAQKTHPDKNNGDDRKFKLVTLSYKLLLKKIKDKDTDKIHNDLKDGSMEFIKNQSTDVKQNINMKDFNVELFNKIYEENKLQDDFHDNGYGDWLKKEDDVKMVKMTSYNKDKFNQEFQKAKHNLSNSRQVQKYSEPKELICSSNIDSIMVLGGDKVKSYTGETNGLQFRDLREAFEEPTLIDINNVDISNRNTNIKDYNRERSNINYKMSNSDLQKLALREEKQKQDELLRIKRLKERDQKHFNQYERIHKRLIG